MAVNPPIDIPPRYERTTSYFQGGQGSVFICKDTYLNRHVAIKFSRDARFQHIIKGEISQIAGIKSKHVIGLYDVLTESDTGILGMVMEYLPGTDLQSYKAANAGEFLKLLFQIASGISDIHQAGVIHRDIKVQNMKFSQEGILKIFDFGISCEQDDGETDAARGTKVYRAPEYYKARPLSLTMAADVYAFSVTAWWLIENSFPDELKTIPPTTPRSFSSCGLTLPDSVSKILDLALGQEPSGRPTMMQIRDTISDQILYGSHKARFSSPGYPTVELNIPGKIASVTYSETCWAKIYYTGLEFHIIQVTGDVYLNGVQAKVGDPIPGSCVIILGSPPLGWQRKFVTCDVSHPEVII